MLWYQPTRPTQVIACKHDAVEINLRCAAAAAAVEVVVSVRTE